MQLFLSSPECLVYDNWLEEPSLKITRDWLRAHRYFAVLREGGRGPSGTIEDLKEGIERGAYRLLGSKFVVKLFAEGIVRNQIPYPSKTPLDLILDRVSAMLPELKDHLGVPPQDWQRLGVGPRLYPPGFGLDEHDDSDSFGTFVLYLHEYWADSWGGELKIAEHSIQPLPNRCVFVKGGTPHHVQPVAQGGGIRTSVIGYARTL